MHLLRRLGLAFALLTFLCIGAVSAQAAVDTAPVVDSNILSDITNLMTHGKDSGIGAVALYDSAMTHWQSFKDWPGWEWWRLLVLFCGVALGIVLKNLVTLMIRRGMARIFGFVNPDTSKIVCNTIAAPFGWTILALFTYLGTTAMATTSETLYVFTWNCFLAALCIIGTWFLCRLADMAAEFVTLAAKRKGTEANPVLLMLLRAVMKAVIVVMAVLFIGDQFGMKIGTLLAGAGVLGLAIAFAAQDTVANVFGSVMVILDKPYNVGDYVKIGGDEGTVLSSGLRSTRLRNLDGHIIMLPNKGCASATIVNVTARRFMRQVMELGLVYETTPAQMKRACEILVEIVNSLPGSDPSNPPSAIFFSYGASSVNIRLIAFFRSVDANGKLGPVVVGEYVKWLNDLNQQIFERFYAEGLSFAYPTNVTYIKKDA